MVATRDSCKIVSNAWLNIIIEGDRKIIPRLIKPHHNSVFVLYSWISTMVLFEDNMVRYSYCLLVLLTHCTYMIYVAIFPSNGANEFDILFHQLSKYTLQDWKSNVLLLPFCRSPGLEVRLILRRLNLCCLSTTTWFVLNLMFLHLFSLGEVPSDEFQ